MATRISIAGHIGSGKTTIARKIADRLGVEALSTGGIQRYLAAQRGISTLELNILAEKDQSIDYQIDDYLRKLPERDIVIESRMAWRFVPNTTKVFLYIIPEEAAFRVFEARRGDESYKDASEALAFITNRRKSELKRFKKYYDVDIDYLGNYDLVVDTTFSTPKQVADTILDSPVLRYRPGIWLSPFNLVPTEGIRDLSAKNLEIMINSISTHGFLTDEPIGVLYVNNTFFIVDGHTRFAAAIKLRIPYVPLKLLASEHEHYIPGLSARDYVAQAVRDSRIYDWEDALGFRYKHAIWRASLS